MCPVRDADSAGSLRIKARAQGNPALQLLSVPLGTPETAERLGATLGSEPVDAVVSCIASRSGGIRDSEQVEYQANKQLLDWALEHGAGHFTLLSAICVQKPRLAFQHAKRRFEETLIASPMSHSIVRPTAFFKSLSGQLDRVRAGKPFLLFGDGELTRCKPIGEADLARYLRLTLEDESLRGILPIGGPGPAISPLEQAAMLARLTAQPPRTRSVSPRLLSGIATLLDVPGRLFPTIADKAEFARIGHYYATESMLVWDETTQRYDADATPEFGEYSLEESYRAQLAGEDVQALGEHAMFS